MLQVAKKKNGGGDGRKAVQMYGEEVILKCGSAVAAVVDLHCWLQCFSKYILCLSLSCRRSGHKWGYPESMLKKKRVKSHMYLYD